MFFISLLKVLHVLAAGWFVAGVVARNGVAVFAARATGFEAMAGLLRAAEFFERRMVIPGSEAVFVLGLAAAWAAGWPILGFIEGAVQNWLLVSLVLYLALIPFIPLLLVPRRRTRTAALDAALAAGRVTPELAAAVADPAVRNFRLAELAVIVIIAILMVAKPF
ncbi:MAG TPA: DUF2269 family protein [Bauldia sp.]|nr:DUF2269 family protein [Bauldia sp.]